MIRIHRSGPVPALAASVLPTALSPCCCNSSRPISQLALRRMVEVQAGRQHRRWLYVRHSILRFLQLQQKIDRFGLLCGPFGPPDTKVTYYRRPQWTFVTDKLPVPVFYPRQFWAKTPIGVQNWIRGHKITGALLQAGRFSSQQ